MATVTFFVSGTWGASAPEVVTGAWKSQPPDAWIFTEIHGNYITGECIGFRV